MPPSRVDRSAAFFIFVAVCAAYFNSFFANYQFDDYNVIVNDASVATLSGWWHAQPSIRPLLKLTYALNNASGLGVAGFHAVNLLIHLINSLLVYAILRRLTHDDDIVFRDQRLAAFLAALVFALHPAQTEAVTYVSGRSTSLAAMFALLSMLIWLRGREYEDPHDIYLRSPFVFLLALLCKEYVVVLPVALLLLARLQSGRIQWFRYALRESFMHWIVLLAGAVGAALLVPRYRELALASLETRDIVTNLLTQANAIGYLVGQLIRFDRLNADPALQVVSGFDVSSIALASAVIALLLLGLLALRGYAVLAFAILWFFLWLAPTNSFVPRLDVANDRQLYIALLGPALGIARVILRVSPRVLQWALVPVVIFGLAYATWQRNLVYEDEIVFWGDVAEKSPHNARAFANLGHALAIACRTADAERALSQAFELDPNATQPVINLALLRAGTLPGVPSDCVAQSAPAPAPETSPAPAPEAAPADRASEATPPAPASDAPPNAKSEASPPAATPQAPSPSQAPQ